MKRHLPSKSPFALVFTVVKEEGVRVLFIFILFHILRSIYYFILFVLLCLSFFSLSVYRGSWRMYVVLVIAQQNGMACTIIGNTAVYNVTACVVVL